MVQISHTKLVKLDVSNPCSNVVYIVHYWPTMLVRVYHLADKIMKMTGKSNKNAP